jgi:hypothetical protein
MVSCYPLPCMACLGHSRMRSDQHHSRATLTAAGGSTFGIKTFGSSSYEANGGAGTYKVDSLTNKPAYTAFKQALAS